MAKKPVSVYGKWNFIRTYFSDPCDAPVTIYALLMVAATAETIYLMYGLDLNSIFYTALKKHSGIQRPRAGRKGMRGDKGGRWKKRPNLTRFIPPDPNEILGNNIGKASPLAGRPMPRGLGWLWLIYGILDFTGFVVFFISVITQWWFRWTSMLYNSRYCQARDDAVVLATRDEGVVSALTPPTPLPANEIQKIRGPIAYNPGTIVLPKSWTGIITGGCSVTSYLEGLPVIFRCWIERNGTTVEGTEQIIEVPWGETFEFGTAYNFAQGGTLQILVDCDIGIARLTQITCYAQAQEPKKTPVPT